MPIRFSVDDSRTCFHAVFEGRVTDEELNASYRDFLASGEWDPGMNQFVDLSSADLTGVTSGGLLRLEADVRAVFEKLSVTPYKTAVHATGDAAIGIVRIYEALSYESPATIRIFSDASEARAWVTSRAPGD